MLSIRELEILANIKQALAMSQIGEVNCVLTWQEVRLLIRYIQQLEKE